MSHWDAIGLGVFAAVISCFAFTIAALYGIQYTDDVGHSRPAHGAGHMVGLFAVVGFVTFFFAWVAIINAPLLAAK